jgi:hypothetical protein
MTWIKKNMNFVTQPKTGFRNVIFKIYSGNEVKSARATADNVNKSALAAAKSALATAENN